ncbi:hypothetical protein PTE30175_02384 [Pandoraea terrae]|uniref:Lipoprotein n=1 Tax=Pandoraea terrae TaxID=1537710 RepID=A0A5E4V5A5_9BURK|nr:hypothetical protein PTE30175_02384 [Pandoraea terrae]
MKLSRFIRELALTVLALALSGCSGISTQFRPAAEALDGDRARLRVIGNGLVKAIPGKSCIDWSSPGAGTVLGRLVASNGFRGRQIGMPSSRYADPADSAELYVAANQPITLMILTDPAHFYSCGVAVTFIPKKGHDYEALLELNSSFCSAKVVSLTEPHSAVNAAKAERCEGSWILGRGGRANSDSRISGAPGA